MAHIYKYARDSTIFLRFLIFSFCLIYGVSARAHIGYSPHGVIEAVDQARRNLMAEYGQSVFTLHVNLFATITTKDGKKQQQVSGFTATAFVAREEGYFLTVYHAVDKKKEKEDFLANLKKKYDALPIPEKVEVEFTTEYTIVNSEKQKFPVRVIAKDPALDVAILSFNKNDGVSLKAFSLGDEKKALYGSVVSIGAPFGISDMLVDGTLARSSLHDCEESGGNYILFMSAINPGNSGGPIILLETSEVIGMVDAIILKENGHTSISCGIPGSVLKKFLDQNLPREKK
jgi:S1-C subfamily serine protease